MSTCALPTYFAQLSYDEALTVVYRTAAAVAAVHYQYRVFPTESTKY